MKQREELLRNISLFQNLSIEQLEKIWQISTVRKYKKKSVIFHEGTNATSVYFILDGLVKTFKIDENGNKHIISFLKKGDGFPHTNIFEHFLYPATAETIIDSLLLSMSIETFEQLLIDTPALSLQMIRTLGEKIRQLQFKLQQLASQDVQDRAISFLLRLADHYGEWKDDFVHIDIPLTHQELADAIGSSRETVNRLISQLRKENIVKIERHRLTIIDYQKLKERVK